MMMVATAVSNTSFMLLGPQLPVETLLSAHVHMPSLEKTHGEKIHGHPWLLSASELQGKFDDAIGAKKRPFSPRERAVLLIRDPLDVMVSSFYHRRFRETAMEGQKMDFRLWGNTSLDDLVWDADFPGGLATQVAFLNAWVPTALAHGLLL